MPQPPLLWSTRSAQRRKERQGNRCTRVFAGLLSITSSRNSSCVDFTTAVLCTGSAFYMLLSVWEATTLCIMTLECVHEAVSRGGL